MPNSVQVRAARSTDTRAITDIYNHYIRETIITFEEEPILETEMAKRLDAVQSAPLPWLVAEERGRVVGYAYGGMWKPRSGYRYSSEITVYCAPDCGGRGIGSALYGALFPELERRGIHAVVGGIALPNEASVALHEKFGMRRVALFEQQGFKFGRWIDVGYWQRLLQTS